MTGCRFYGITKLVLAHWRVGIYNEAEEYKVLTHQWVKLGPGASAILLAGRAGS